MLFLYLMRFPSLYPLCTYFLSLSIFGVGNGNPVQYSCLENSMDRGAWQASGPWCLKESDMTEHTSPPPLQRWRVLLLT